MRCHLCCLSLANPVRFSYVFMCSSCYKTQSPERRFGTGTWSPGTIHKPTQVDSAAAVLPKIRNGQGVQSARAPMAREPMFPYSPKSSQTEEHTALGSLVLCLRVRMPTRQSFSLTPAFSTGEYRL